MKNLRKKSIAIFMILVLLLQIIPAPISIAAGGKAIFSLSTVSGEPKDTVTVDFKVDSITDSTGFTTAEFIITYDKNRLELPYANNNELLNILVESLLLSKPVNANQIALNHIEEDGTIRIAWAANGPAAAVNTAGLLAKIDFKIKENAPAGDAAVDLSVEILEENGPVNLANEIAQQGIITVNTRPLNSITLNKSETEIDIEESETLSVVSYSPTDTTDAITVNWTSDNEAVATVNSTGVVTGVSRGEANITATSTVNSSVKASCKVTVNAPLKNITITGSLSTLAPGQTTDLGVTYDPLDTTDTPTIVWTSGATGVATVDINTGVVTAVADGTATITATVDGSNPVISDTYEITVDTIELISIGLTETEITLNKDAEKTLVVTYNPTDTTEAGTVTWNSSDPTIATVDSDGKVKAVKGGGPVTITATSTAHPELTATCEVTVVVPVTDISIKETTALNKTETITGTETLTVTYLPNDTTQKDVTWVSSNTAVVTVDGNGLITAVAPGTAEITVISDESNAITDKCTVTVNSPLENISLNHTTGSLEPNQTLDLDVTYDPVYTTDSKTVTWTSSNENAATVDTNGVVTAVGGIFSADKTTTITATVGGKTATCVITVTPIELDDIVLSSSTLTLNRDETTTLTVTLNPSDATVDTTVTWTTGNSSIATVDNNGLVTAKGPGTTTITATVDGKSKTCTVTVLVPLISIDLNETAYEITGKGNTYQLSVTLNPTDTTDPTTVTWTSSNENVATVDSNGLVTSVGGGQAQITAKVGNFTKICTITVRIPVTDIDLDNDNIELLLRQTQVLNVIYDPVDTTEREIEWISSDPSVTVDANGKVTAVSEGTATIRATSKANGTLYAECTVVSKRMPLDSIAIEEQDITLLKGKTQQLTVLYNPDNTTDDRTVTWKSSDLTIATIDSNGIVKGLKKGTVTITASVGGLAPRMLGADEDEVKIAETEITVEEIPLESVNIDKTFVSNTIFTAGGKYKLSVNLYPANTTDDVVVVWMSSDPTIATVDENGEVTALKQGTVTFTAYVNGQIVDTVTLDVQADLSVDKNVETGDINLGLIIFLMVSSLMVIVTRIRKRNVKSRR